MRSQRIRSRTSHGPGVSEGRGVNRARWVALGVVLALAGVIAPVGPTLWHKLTTKTIYNPNARTDGGYEILTVRRWSPAGGPHGFAREWDFAGDGTPFFAEKHLRNGVPDGVVTIYDADGAVEQALFDKGKLSGLRFRPPWDGEVKTKDEVLKLFRGE